MKEEKAEVSNCPLKKAVPSKDKTSVAEGKEEVQIKEEQSDGVSKVKPEEERIANEIKSKHGLCWIASRIVDYSNFDNIGYAIVTIFQSITLEGWSDIMYFYQDGASMISSGARSGSYAPAALASRNASNAVLSVSPSPSSSSSSTSSEVRTCPDGGASSRSL